MTKINYKVNLTIKYYYCIKKFNVVYDFNIITFEEDKKYTINELKKPDNISYYYIIDDQPIKLDINFNDHFLTKSEYRKLKLNNINEKSNLY